MQGLDLATILINAGPAGIVVLLYSLGWIVPKPTVDRMTADKDQWQKLYETERAAHETTRKALVDQASAATAAIAAAQTTEKLLTEMRQRPGATT